MKKTHGNKAGKNCQYRNKSCPYRRKRLKTRKRDLKSLSFFLLPQIYPLKATTQKTKQTASFLHIIQNNKRTILVVF